MEREKLDEITEKLGEIIDRLPSNFYGVGGLNEYVLEDLRKLSEIYKELSK